jgi:hypothetical protein
MLNLFPARVQTPDGEIRRARVYVKDGRARVFTAGKGGIELARDVEVTDFQAGRTRGPHTIESSLGTWTVTKDSGCGCGNPLKRFDPRTWKEEVPA